MSPRQKQLCDAAAPRIVDIHKRGVAEEMPPMVVVVCDLLDEAGRQLAEINVKLADIDPAHDFWVYGLSLRQWNRQHPTLPIKANAQRPFAIVTEGQIIMGEMPCGRRNATGSSHGVIEGNQRWN